VNCTQYPHCGGRLPELPTSSQYRRTEFNRIFVMYKGKAIPLQAWTIPEGSRKLRFPDCKTHEGGKVVSPTHRPRLPQEIFLVIISVTG